MTQRHALRINYFQALFVLVQPWLALATPRDAGTSTEDDLRARLQHHVTAELNKLLSVKDSLGKSVEGGVEQQRLELKFELPEDLAELVNREGAAALKIHHVGRKENDEVVFATVKDADSPAGASTTYEVSLCPYGYVSTAESPCEPCAEGMTTLYRGASSCVGVTREDLLGMLYGLIDGDNWSKQQRRGWKSYLPACDWEGVSCDLTGEINGMAIPLAGLKTEEDISNWHM